MSDGSRYDYSFDPNGTSWPARLLSKVPRGASVLELGPGPGAMSRVLRGLGHSLTAVEFDSESARKLSEVGVDVIVADLNQNGWVDALGTRKFDVILACDVLEHLPDPEKILCALRGFLVEDGHIIVSIPNIAYMGVVSALIGGKFEYSDKGILDSTHLRFFSKSSFTDLLLKNGWIPRFIEPNRVPVNDSEFAYAWSQISPAVAEGLSLHMVDGDAYQWMFVAALASQQSWQKVAQEELAAVKSQYVTLLKQFQDLKSVYEQENASLREHQKAFSEAKDIIASLTSQNRQMSLVVDQLKADLDVHQSIVNDKSTSSMSKLLRRILREG